MLRRGAAGWLPACLHRFSRVVRRLSLPAPFLFSVCPPDLPPPRVKVAVRTGGLAATAAFFGCQLEPRGAPTAQMPQAHSWLCLLCAQLRVGCCPRPLFAGARAPTRAHTCTRHTHATHAPTHTRAPLQTHTHTHARKRAHTHTRTHKHTCTPPRAPRLAQAPTQAQAHTPHTQMQSVARLMLGLTPCVSFVCRRLQSVLHEPATKRGKRTSLPTFSHLVR